MTYPEAILFLYSLRTFGAKFGLENTIKLAALAGNPQAQLRFIHVAGTNGKGSTCAMLESIYRAAGYRVGLFTSPHLVSFRERIQVDRRLIPENDVVRLVDEMQPWLQQFAADHHPTFFEVITVMALRYFAKHQCDLVIWETGLGGRLDATNIVTPLASVITNIGWDHQQWLGDTLPKIAAEKAGIIKPGVPVLTATDEPEARTVIEATAREKGAPFEYVQKITPPLHLRGVHQQRNAALAAATVECLNGTLPVPASVVPRGLKLVRWRGRFQAESVDGRLFYLDGAHNIPGAHVLAAAVKQELPNGKPILILGILRDKNWQEVCTILAPLASRILTVPVASERTASAAELAEVCRHFAHGAEVTACPSLRHALESLPPRCIVLVTGSLYLMGEAMELLKMEELPPSDEKLLNEWTARKS